jgi:putative glutamine amidotransferase
MILISPYTYINKYKKVCYSINKEWEIFANKLNDNLFILTHKCDLKKIKKDNIKMIILSGGGDIFHIKKSIINKSRDQFDSNLIKFAIKNQIPILAVCRSFQLVAYLYKANLYKKKNPKKHLIFFKKKILNYTKKLMVNSYHLVNIKKLSKDFDIIATNSDDFIEIAYNKKSKMLCLMPHPEREFYSKSLTPLIKNFLL